MTPYETYYSSLRGGPPPSPPLPKRRGPDMPVPLGGHHLESVGDSSSRSRVPDVNSESKEPSKFGPGNSGIPPFCMVDSCPHFRSRFLSSDDQVLHYKLFHPSLVRCQEDRCVERPPFFVNDFSRSRHDEQYHCQVSSSSEKEQSEAGSKKQPAFLGKSPMDSGDERLQPSGLVGNNRDQGNFKDKGNETQHPDAGQQQIHPHPFHLSLPRYVPMPSQHSALPSPTSANSSFRPSRWERELKFPRPEGPVVFQTNTFKNSHYNVAHYNNPNFQPEEWSPDGKVASSGHAGVEHVLRSNLHNVEKSPQMVVRSDASDVDGAQDDCTHFETMSPTPISSSVGAKNGYSDRTMEKDTSIE